MDVAMLLLLSLLALVSSPARSEDSSWINAGDRPFSVSFHGELGYIGALSHRIQFGQDGTELNYVQDGGQDLLFPFVRASAEVGWKRSAVVLLYQPLRLETRVLLDEDLVVDEQVFEAGTPVDLLYNFPYWRASYLYDLLPNEAHELSVGLSLQFRNATIDFASGDGTLLRTNRSLGPVPALKARYHRPLGKHTWMGAEIDGFWAPIKYLNGSDSDVEGAIVDATVRAGLTPRAGLHPFLSVRYIAGGGVGTESSPEPPGDGFNRNWLHVLAVSVGATVR